jgi:glucose-6-phosphate 1-dehydrogenase
VPAAFEDAAGYATLGKLLAEVEARYGTCGNRMYYLATPPTSYTAVVEQLGAAKLVSEPWPELSSPDWPCWSRVIVEKPFGHDLRTAAALNVEIHKVFHESQVYRIDHYLGKETVQNILAFRFGNSIFEPLWNRRYVDHVQLLVGEDLGVEGRGGYYDTAGAVRDMVQNHMLQLLSRIAFWSDLRTSALLRLGDRPFLRRLLEIFTVCGLELLSFRLAEWHPQSSRA